MEESGDYSNDRPADGAPLLYHLHVPKTAGTSLFSVLACRFAAPAVAPLPCGLEELAQLPSLVDFELWGGHLEFGYYLAELTGRPVTTVTLLRDPRAVVLSLYKQALSEPLDPLHQYVKEHCPRLGAFISDPRMIPFVHNCQTRFLGLAERRFSPALIRELMAAPAAERAERLRQINECERGIQSAELLPAALERLQGCLHVGLAEEFETSLRQLARALGWIPFNQLPHDNVSAMNLRWSEISPWIRRRIDALTECDRALYEYARKRFREDEQRLAA